MSEDPSDRNRKDSNAFIRDLSLASIAPFVKKVKGVALIPVITKWVGAGAFGVWKQFSITSGFIAVLATVGTAQVVNRYLAPMERPERYSAHFLAIASFVLGVSLLFTAGLLAVPQFASVRIFGEDTSLVPLLFLAAYLPVLAFSNRLLTFLRSRRRFDIVAPLAVVRDLGSIILVATLILLWKEIEYAIGGLFLWEVGGMIATFELARRKANLKIVSPDFSEAKKYFSFGVPLVLVTVGSRLAEFADRYVIVNTMGIEEVGIYSVAYAGGAIGVLFLKPIQRVLLPDFSVLVERGKRKKLERRLRGVVKYFIASQFGILIALIFLGEAALLLVSNRSFLSGLAVLQIIPFGIMAYGLLQIGTQVLNAEESTRLVGLIWICVGALNVITNLFAVPVFGLEGAAMATVLSYIMGAAACWVILLRSYSLQFQWGIPLKILVSVAVTGILLFLCKKYTDLDLIYTLTVQGCIGSIVYVGVLLLSGFVDKKEKRLMRENLNPKMSNFLARIGIV